MLTMPKYDEATRLRTHNISITDQHSIMAAQNRKYIPKTSLQAFQLVQHMKNVFDGVIRMLFNCVVAGVTHRESESKIADVKPEVHVSQLVDLMESKFSNANTKFSRTDNSMIHS